MKSFAHNYLAPLILLLLSQGLSAQGTVNFSHSTAGDLTNRTASREDERTSHPVGLNDSILSQERNVSLSGTLPTSTKMVTTGPPVYFNRDSNLLQLRNGNSRMSDISVRNVPDTTRPFGQIPISSSVSPFGARLYSIPIPVAAGNNLSPEIGLTYNSLGGEGKVGYGWELSGFSSITVRNRSFYYDSITAPAVYGRTDEVYSLDGVPLVQNSVSEMSSYDYETVSGHILVKKILNNEDRVICFKALFPDGRRAIFGFPDADDPDAEYPITEMSDLYGDVIKYSYLSLGTVPYYPETVVYGRSQEDTIKFTYSSLPVSFIPAHIAYQAYRRPYLLSSIVSIAGTDTLSCDVLSHEQRYGTSLLRQYSRSRGGEDLNPLVFEYGQTAFSSIPRVEMNRAVQTDSAFISWFRSDSTVFYSRGRLRNDEVNDGVIFHLQGDPYGMTSTSSLGSLYPSSGYIVIYPVISSFVSPTILNFGAGFQEIQAVDIDGDGRDEVVKTSLIGASGDSTIIAIQTYGFSKDIVTGKDTLLPISVLPVKIKGKNNLHGHLNPAMMKYYYGDFTGEGRIQMLIISAGFTDSHRATKVVNLNDGTIAYDGYTINPNLVLCRDIDGDGQTELCQATDSGFVIRRLIDGEFSVRGISSTPSPSSFQKMIAMGDLNADGYIDILTASSQEPGLDCFSYNGLSFDSLRVSTIYQRSSEDQVQLVDVNRDGYDDLVLKRADQVIVALNSLGTFSPCNTTRFTIDESADVIPGNVVTGGTSGFLLAFQDSIVYQYSFPDANRSVLRQLTSCRNSLGDIQRNYYLNLPDDASYGSIYYRDTSRHYSLEDGYFSQMPNMSVLSEEKVFTENAIPWSTWHQYVYFDAVFHRKGLGFRGFGSIIEEDLSNLDIGEDGLMVFTNTVYDPENGAVPVRVVRRLGDAAGTLIDSTLYCYSKLFHPYRKHTPRLDTIVVINCIDDLRTITRYQYDTYDFVSSLHSVKLALDTIPGPGRALNTDVCYQYGHQVNNTDSLWLLGNVTSQVVTKFNDNSELGWEERTNYTYSLRKNKPNTALTYVGLVDYNEGILEADNLLSEVHYTYDTHGNVLSERTATYGGTAFRGPTYSYDAQGRFLLSETDAAGLTTSYSGYNIFGKPTTVTDPRGNVTSYTYDNWGNLTSVTHPDGSTENTSRQWVVDEDLGSLYKVTVSGNASPTQTTWYSSLGQELRTGTKRFNGDIIYTDKQYSNSGRLLRESLPYKMPVDTIRWNTTSYDTLGRISSITAASGAVTSYVYNGRTTGTTKEGITITRTVGADGDVYLSQDLGGDIRYFYCPDGQPDSVRVMVAGTASSPVWATTRFTYDDYGRRTSVIDPSAGTRSDAYTDNADGSSSVVHTTSNGTVTTYRDTLGRIILVQRHDNGSIPVPDPDEPEERAQRVADTLVAGTAIDSAIVRNPSSTRSAEFNTTYTYNGYGDLVSAVSNNGTSTYYTYDTYGRIATQRENIPGSQWLQRSFSYDTAGRVVSTAYTTGSGISVTENYSYTNGYHTATMAMNSIIWQLQGENALGQPTLAYTGSAARRYYYDVYGFPTRRELESAEGATTMDFRYSYHHPTGNMTWREDATREVTNEDYARETFTYDGLNRLTAMDDNLLSGSRDVTYSNSGNITSIDGNGDFYYPNNQSRYPYRISGGDIGEYAWCPDPNIDMGYTAYDRPMYINGSSGLVTFSYNDAGERVSTVSSVYMGSEEGYRFIWGRYYIGGRYEREVINNTVRETLWLGGDAYRAPMIFYRENNSGGALYNIGRDVQGSITHLATVNGDLLKEYSYDPWGRMRNPDTHVFPTYGPLPSGEGGGDERSLTTILIPAIHRGYCGHEHLEQFGLINMNARLYDPFTGRFYSPDPYVQMPDFSQNFNRYAYCLNNPLKYEDESGEYAGLDDLVAAGIGGLVNVISNAIQGNLNGKGWFGRAAAAFGAGAIGAWASLYPEFGGLAIGGAIVSSTNAWIEGKDGEDIAIAAGFGAATSIIGGVAGEWGSKTIGSIIINGLGVTGPVLKGAISGGFGSAFAGYVVGFTVSLINTWDISQAHHAGLLGAKIGMATGSIGGLIAGYKYAKNQKINPWTGKPIDGVVIGEDMSGRVSPAANDLEATTISKDWKNDNIGDAFINNEPSTKGLEYNAQWIQNKMNKSVPILDIGPKGSVPYSPYYKLETGLTSSYPYLFPASYNSYSIPYLPSIRIIKFKY